MFTSQTIALFAPQKTQNLTCRRGKGGNTVPCLKLAQLCLGSPLLLNAARLSDTTNCFLGRRKELCVEGEIFTFNLKPMILNVLI